MRVPAFPDLAALRRDGHLRMAALAVLLALLLAVGGWQRLQSGQTALESARHALRQAQQRLDQARREAADRERDATRWSAIVERRMLRDSPHGRRGDIDDLLDNLQRQLSIPRLHHESAATRPLTPGSEDGLHATRLSLRLHVLHEAALLAFLDTLQARAPALIVVQGCVIARLPANDEHARLQADCEADWVDLPAGRDRRP